MRLTLVFLMRDNEILLALKKRGHGEGLWNGIGGKVESGETISQAMVRECREEINVVPLHYQRIARISFLGGSGGMKSTVIAFECKEWDKEPQETEEMKPQWFKILNIPYQQMWSGDAIWLPLALSGGYFEGEIEYDKNNEVINHNIVKVRD